MRRQTTYTGSVVEKGHRQRESLSIGVEGGKIVLRLGENLARMPPEVAEQIAVDLHSFAVEVRRLGPSNG